MRSFINHPATALEEFPRIVFSFFAMFLPIEGLKKKYLERRAAGYTGQKYS